MHCLVNCLRKGKVPSRSRSLPPSLVCKQCWHNAALTSSLLSLLLQMSLGKISLCTELQITVPFWCWLLLCSLFSLCSCAKASSAFLHPWPVWAFMSSESLKKQMFERGTQLTRVFEKRKKLKWVEFRINMLFFSRHWKQILFDIFTCCCILLEVIVH